MIATAFADAFVMVCRISLGAGRLAGNHAEDHKGGRIETEEHRFADTRASERICQEQALECATASILAPLNDKLSLFGAYTYGTSSATAFSGLISHRSTLIAIFVELLRDVFLENVF